MGKQRPSLRFLVEDNEFYHRENQFSGLSLLLLDAFIMALQCSFSVAS